MNAFLAHFAFDFRTGIRNKNLLLMNYLFPLGIYLLISGIMSQINPLFQATILPAMVTFGVLGATLLGMPDGLVTGRENGIFRSYKINGVPARSILLIPALSTMMHLTVVMVVIVVTAPLLFDAPAAADFPTFLLVFAALLVACAGLSLLIGVISPSTRLTVLYSQLIFLPSMLVGGVMLPYEMLPSGVQLWAQLLPSTHAMNAFSGLAMGGAAAFNPWVSVFALFACGIMAFFLALYLFSWDSRNTRRRGHPLLALLAFLPFVIGIVVS